VLPLLQLRSKCTLQRPRELDVFPRAVVRSMQRMRSPGPPRGAQRAAARRSPCSWTSPRSCPRRTSAADLP